MSYWYKEFNNESIEVELEGDGISIGVEADLDDPYSSMTYITLTKEQAIEFQSFIQNLQLKEQG